MTSYFLSRYRQFKPFFKYSIVGATGTLIDIGALFFLVEYAHLPILLAATISFLCAVINNFILNKKWTFQNRSKNYRKLFIKFFIVSCIGLILNNFCMYTQVMILGIWYIYAKLITSLLVLSWNFLANKYWTFPVKEKSISIPKKFKYDLSIVIPVFNEENRIKNTLLNIQDYIMHRNINAEIIISNDGSTDKTHLIIEERQKTMKNLSLIGTIKNKGKGAAVKNGIQRASGEYILMTDADHSTPIEELDRFIPLMNEFDIIIGSRYLKDSHVKIKQPLTRVLIGRIGNALIQLFLINNIKDTQCGFKLFKHATAKNVFALQKVHRWGFDMEIIAIAQSLDYKIKEIPVSWFDSPESRFRPLKDCLYTFLELLYIKLNFWCGRYK